MTSLGKQMVNGLTEFCDALESGKPIEKLFTVRTVKVKQKTKTKADLYKLSDPHKYDPPEEDCPYE